MKNLYFLLLLSFTPVLANAQCIAYAGPDQHVCGQFFNQNGDTIILGGQPIVMGGMAPYDFQWIFHDSLGSTHIFGSHLLSDTSIANPKLVDSWGDSMKFVLKVTDANNLICFDTVMVTTSTFSTHLGQYTIHVNAGDTVQFPFGPNVISSRPVVEYLWLPNHGMIDSTSAKPNNSSHPLYRLLRKGY